MPTPRTSDTNGAGSHGTGGPDLRTIVSLLPTPRASDVGTPGRRASEGFRPPLSQVVLALLPTPTATPYGNNQSASAGAAVRPSLESLAPTLMPTPTVADSRGTRNMRLDGTPYGSGYGTTLTDAVTLLPTPVTADGNRGSLTYSRGNPTLAGALFAVTQEEHPSEPVVEGAQDWGVYAAAIARHEETFGRPAPLPADEERRLAPEFVEWMMALPVGHVTAVPVVTRNAQLKALGNGVVPAQAAAALRLLLDRIPHPTSALITT